MCDRGECMVGDDDYVYDEPLKPNIASNTAWMQNNDMALPESTSERHYGKAGATKEHIEDEILNEEQNQVEGNDCIEEQDRAEEQGTRTTEDPSELIEGLDPKCNARPKEAYTIPPQIEREDDKEADEELRARYAYHNQRVRQCKDDLEVARFPHDEHSHQYEDHLAPCSYQHPDQTEEQLEQDFGLIFVQRWQELIQEFKSAEKALEDVRRNAAAEPAKCAIERWKKAKEEDLLERVAADTN